MIDFIGFAAAILTTVAFLPQVVKTLASRSARDLSLPMLVIMAAGILLWLLYGIALGQVPLILANGATFCLVAILPGLKLRETVLRED